MKDSPGDVPALIVKRSLVLSVLTQWRNLFYLHQVPTEVIAVLSWAVFWLKLGWRAERKKW